MNKWLLGIGTTVLLSAIVVPNVARVLSAPEKVEDLESASVQLTNIVTAQQEMVTDHDKKIMIHEKEFEFIEQREQKRDEFYKMLIEEVKK